MYVYTSVWRVTEIYGLAIILQNCAPTSRTLEYISDLGETLPTTLSMQIDSPIEDTLQQLTVQHTVLYSCMDSWTLLHLSLCWSRH